MNVYTIELDRESGAVLGEPATLPGDFFGSNLSPAWSPDGQSLVYVSRRGAIMDREGSFSLVIDSVEGGESRELTPEILRIVDPRWSPDGKTFVVRGFDNEGNWGLHHLDAETGEVLGTLIRGRA